MALLALEADPEIEIAALLTTLGERERRISMHGVREALLQAQAHALGLRLAEVVIPAECDNETYAARMAEALDELADEGVTAVAFGDLFLEDVRAFRERRMRALGLQPLFPIWATPTSTLAHAFVDSGHRAVVTCVDGAQLDPVFLGREYDAAFLADLPPDADPCGERGEFHSFVYAGPRFAADLHVRHGRRKTVGDRFHFLDLIPAPAAFGHV